MKFNRLIETGNIQDMYDYAMNNQLSQNESNILFANMVIQLYSDRDNGKILLSEQEEKEHQLQNINYVVDFTLSKLKKDTQYIDVLDKCLADLLVKSEYNKLKEKIEYRTLLEDGNIKDLYNYASNNELSENKSITIFINMVMQLYHDKDAGKYLLTESEEELKKEENLNYVVDFALNNADKNIQYINMIDKCLADITTKKQYNVFKEKLDKYKQDTQPSM